MKLEAAEIKKRLKKAIENNPNINQKVVASIVGVSRSHISQILDDKRKGDLDILIKIADAAGISLAKIMVAEATTTGAEGGKNQERQKTISSEKDPAGDPADPVENLLRMTRKILESDSNWSDSLASDIKSFYKGMVIESGDRRKFDQPDKIPISGERRKAVG